MKDTLHESSDYGGRRSQLLVAQLASPVGTVSMELLGGVHTPVSSYKVAILGTSPVVSIQQLAYDRHPINCGSTRWRAEEVQLRAML